MSFYFFLFGILAADQFSKFLALKYLAQTDTVPILPNIFHLTLVHNTGIAFGFFRQHPGLLLSLITLSLVFLFYWASKIPAEDKVQRFALAIILGGAVGNWIDRLRFGAVIDFLDFRIWPVFNAADSAITVGVTILAWIILKKKNI